MITATTIRETTNQTQFLDDILTGLRSSPKFMQSKYFYDETGDRIFQKIMNLDEYYLTNAEMEILSEQSAAISKAITVPGEEFDLIELGAGDATKSIHLLRRLMSEGLVFSYLPVDISAHVISDLERNLPQQLPGLKMKGLNGDYLEMLKEATMLSARRKVVLFMGANIGNMNTPDAEQFCRELNHSLKLNDLLIIGFDLKKNPQQILSAYNDSKGVTRAFNLNLLERINRELDGNFNLTDFEHYATYDPGSGACKSYLISLKTQDVKIGSAIIHFEQYEYIFMEISQKYTLHEIDQMAGNSGFTPVKNFFDNRGFFVDSVWAKASS